MEPTAVVFGQGEEFVLGRQETIKSGQAMNEMVTNIFNPEAIANLMKFEDAMRELFPKLAPLEKSAAKKLKNRKDSYDELQKLIRTTLNSTTKVCGKLSGWIHSLGLLRKSLRILTEMAEAKKNGAKGPDQARVWGAEKTWTRLNAEVLEFDIVTLIKELSEVADSWNSIELRCQRESNQWEKLQKNSTGVVATLGAGLLWLSRRMCGLAKAGQAVAEDAKAEYEGAASSAGKVAADLRELAKMCEVMKNQSARTGESAQKAQYVLSGYVYFCLENFRSVDDLRVFLDSSKAQTVADMDERFEDLAQLSDDVVKFSRYCTQMLEALRLLHSDVKISLQATDRHAAPESGMESE